jgi:cytochrome c peroxidase
MSTIVLLLCLAAGALRASGWISGSGHQTINGCFCNASLPASTLRQTPELQFGAGQLLAISIPGLVVAGAAAILRVTMIPVPRQAWRTWLLSASAAVSLLLPVASARADADDALAAAAVAGEIAHAQKMGLLFRDPVSGNQATPPLIPQLEIDPDPSGLIATYQPAGPTVASTNPFFQNLGTNGRTCFTCHEPQDGWGLSAQHAQDRFAADPADPLFRLVDGATCPSDDVSSFEAMVKAYSLVLSKGLIRIGLPMQSSMQFQILSVDDPYGCNTSSITGLTGAQSGTASLYRRPLPSTNLGFLSTIMWDGRESSLFSQAVDAALIHAQANAAPTAAQQQQIIGFEGCTTAFTPVPCVNTPSGTGLFTAQIFDGAAGYLAADGASGGPISLAPELGGFFICVNDPFGCDGQIFNPVIFTAYQAWAKLSGGDPVTQARLSIARGEQVFNSVPITITGVAGINDVLGEPSVPGFCGTCHDTPNAGNHSVKAPLDIGITGAGAAAPPALDISGLPVFTVLCIAGPLAGQTFEVTDIGRAMISGNCADIGKTKGPILRGLAARAPYFHNGSAATLLDVVNFYDQRFGIGFTEQQKSDLVAFLNSL